MIINSADQSLFETILSEGKSTLSLELGIVSKVDGEKYELIAIDDVTSDYKPGEILELNNTFCREVIAIGHTVALTEYDKKNGLSQHPLYSRNALEAYIGSPILVDNKVWGTVNFSSMQNRSIEFSEREILLVESYASKISSRLCA